MSGSGCVYPETTLSPLTPVAVREVWEAAQFFWEIEGETSGHKVLP